MRRHPYILATVIATLLAVVVWSFLPKEYQAITKIADEYKEVDLAIGLNSTEARIKKSLGGGNEGLNNIETYCKVLKSRDFARIISHVQVSDRDMSYGQYLGREDTIDAITDNINYNLHRKTGALTIGFTDKNALVAAQMLDSVIVCLQDFIQAYRHEVDKNRMENAKNEVERALDNYHEAQRIYSMFSDTHQHSLSAAERTREVALLNEVKQSYDYYKNTLTDYIRYQSLVKRPYASFAVIQAPTVPRKTNSSFFAYFFSFVLIALALVKGFRLLEERRKEKSKIEWGGLFSPWSITLLVWMFLLFFIATSTVKLDPLSQQFYISIFLWVPILCITAFTVYNLLPAEQHDSKELISVNNYVFQSLFVIAMIITPLYVYQIYKFVAMFDTKDLMMNVRQLAIYGDGYGILNYTFVINEVVLLIALWRYPKIPLWQLVAIIISCIIYAISNMEKITFFLVFISSIFVLYERGIIRLRAIAVGGLVLLLFFYLFNLARSGEESEYAQEETLLDFVAMYVMSAPVAFGHLQPTITDQFGSDTLWGFYLYFGKYFLGNFEPHQPFQEFVFVPMSTNVYTVMRPFFTDFEYRGVAFFAFLYGVMAGVAYRLMKNKNAFGTCFYTYLVYVFVLQFFDELITASLPLVAQMTILLLLVTQNKFQFTWKNVK